MLKHGCCFLICVLIKYCSVPCIVWTMYNLLCQEKEKGRWCSVLVYVSWFKINGIRWMCVPAASLIFCITLAAVPIVLYHPKLLIWYYDRPDGVPSISPKCLKENIKIHVNLEFLLRTFPCSFNLERRQKWLSFSVDMPDPIKSSPSKLVQSATLIRRRVDMMGIRQCCVGLDFSRRAPFHHSVRCWILVGMDTDSLLNLDSARCISGAQCVCACWDRQINAILFLH